MAPREMTDVLKSC